MDPYPPNTPPTRAYSRFPPSSPQASPPNGAPVTMSNAPPQQQQKYPEIPRPIYPAAAAAAPVVYHPTHPIQQQQQPQVVVAAAGGGGAVGLVRKKTVKRLELFRGNLVINCPVPDRLLHNVRSQQGEEFNAMRYTAVTCDPDDFVRQNYTLRPQLYGRPTEIAICMTMYNEDDHLLSRTMGAVAKNIAHLCQRNRSSLWGPEGWKRIVVVLVADGRSKIQARVLKQLGVMGLWQEDIAKSDVAGTDVQAHLFEYTTQVCVDVEGQVRGAEEGLVPVQMVFCLKEENKKKLNSHRWFFHAFCPLLQPNVCVLLDVGTKPSSTSIYHLWKAFDLDPHLGGACGEITVETGKACLKLMNPLVAAQNFEYKMSNILDKPLESVFGYISVLPGAFSAYRYAALQDSQPGQGPLASYFCGERLHAEGTDNIFKANMYLAEDRILCFELLAKPHARWHLKYVKAAQASTDVPEGVPEFVSQRRRWLNGSFFAAAYAIAHWWRLWGTGHTLPRVLLFQVQYLYNIVQMLFTWFSLGNFYLTFYFLSQSVIGNADPFVVSGTQVGSIVFQLFRNLYIFAIIIIFITSLGNRPQGSKWIYIFCFVLFAIIMGLMLFLSGYTVTLAIDAGLKQTPSAAKSGLSKFGVAFVSSSAFRDIFISLASTFGIYLLSSLLFAEPWHLITSFLQYMMMLPSFTNILMVYAFCNTHDVSWGTKGDNKAVNLGGAKPLKDGHIEVELPFQNLKDKSALNQDYEHWLAAIRTAPPAASSKRDAKTKMEDWYRNFRTHMVLAWMFSNALLIVLLTHPKVSEWMGANETYNPYLSFLFYAVAGLSVVRFIGSILYIFGYWRDRYLSCRC